MLVSPGPSGTEFGIDDTSEVERVPSRRSLEFFAGGANSLTENFHDISSSSVGLLTNNANGGWKRDLSLFTENFNSVARAFPSFTLTPGNVYQASKYDSSASAARRANLYPWLDSSVGQAWPEAVSWGMLADFANQYKEIRSSGSEVAHLVGATGRTHLLWIDNVRLLPVLARIHLIVSLSAEADGRLYVPSIIVNPVLTMWNPYSVALDLSSHGTVPYFLSEGACPLVFDFQVGRSTVSLDLAQITGSGNISHQSPNVQARIPFSSTPLWLPGEVRVFSASGNKVADANKGASITFEEGYRPDSGLRYALRNGNAQYASQAATTAYSVAAEAAVDAYFGGPNVEGIGLYFTSRIGVGANPATRNVQNLINVEDAEKMLGDKVNLTATDARPISELANNPQPFVSVISSLRFARDTNPDQPNIMTNGIHQMNPTIGFITSSGVVGEVPNTSMGGRYDAFPYNIHLYPVNSFTDPGMPSGITGDLEGYLGSGFSSIDGLSNLILLEVPTRPMRTIGDLEHFNVNASHRLPPYTLNAFGNSRPSPFMPPNGIRVENRLSQDHSYAINHVLLDDWFVSTVSPETAPWTPSEVRSVENVYADHLSGEVPLQSHFYRAASNVTESDALEEADNFLNDREAWQKVAAELEVEGMFNINSTSELAWRMLLKRNFQYNGASYVELVDSAPGSDGEVDLRASGASVFPRTSIVSDSAAGANSVLGQPLQFSDRHIEALAREIVVEIQERGPFLSLSEFFNRQLSTDPNLARAGAVENALLRLSESSGGDNPYDPLLAAGFDEEASTADVTGAQLSYPFPEAARGNPAYGFPAWTRQADVLRPVSGILSARDDTFTIRAYGDARDPRTNRVLSRAWCEAVVQRRAEYLDPSEESGDEKYTSPSVSTLNSVANYRFGRRFEMVSFRWLNEDEV